MNWRPIDDPPDAGKERVIDCIVTDGERWTRAVYSGGEFHWLKTHLVAKEDATHYMIPERP